MNTDMTRSLHWVHVVREMIRKCPNKLEFGLRALLGNNDISQKQQAHEATFGMFASVVLIGHF